MLVFEVTLNGKTVCTAGADDLSVLGADVVACGKLGPNTVPAREDEQIDLFYSVGGVTSREDPVADVQKRWKAVEPLSVGDVLQIRVLESATADASVTESPTEKLRRRDV